MNETKGGTSRRRKALSATLAVAMALVMLLSGTLAYFYQSFAVNKFDGKQMEKKAIGHDDFNQETGNKDIYVENAGESPIYVRVKLTEDYCDNEQTTDKENATGLKYMEGFAEVDVDDAIKSGEMVHTSSGPTGNTALGSGSQHQAFHQNYFSWTWGTEGKTYLRAGDESQYGTDEKADKYIKDKVAYDTTNAGRKYTLTEDDDTIGMTADSDGVLTFDQWDALASIADDADIDTKIVAARNKYDFTGWILASNGWYYWSKPLPGGEATGLLLDQVDKKGKVKNNDVDYEYHIHVQFEATNDADVGLWMGTQSEPVDANGDPWKNSSPADWNGQMITQRLIFENTHDVDGLLKKIDDLQSEWQDAILKDGDGNPVLDEESQPISLTSIAAINLLKDAKYGILRSYDTPKAMEKYVQEIDRAKQTEANYAKAKTDFVNKVPGAKDPDVYIMQRDKGEFMDKNANVANYLFTTFGDGTGLTADQAAAVQKIALTGTKEHRIQVDDVSWLTADNFPNLNRFQLAYVDFTEGTSLSLPATVTEIKWDSVHGVTKMDVSALNLTELRLNVTSLTNLTNEENGEGVYGLSNSYNTLVFADLRSFNALEEFDASDMLNVERLYVGSNSSKLKSLTLGNLSKLQVLRLESNSIVTDLDISETGLVSLDTLQFYALKRITCKEGQQIQNKTKHTVYLEVIDSKGTRTYKKIDKNNNVSGSTVGEFTNPPEEA